MQKRNKISPSGNWTPVSRVTGGDTYHYTNEDIILCSVVKASFENKYYTNNTYAIELID